MSGSFFTADTSGRKIGFSSDGRGRALAYTDAAVDAILLARTAWPLFRFFVGECEIVGCRARYNLVNDTLDHRNEREREGVEGEVEP